MLTKETEKSSIDFRKQQVNARPQTAGYYHCTHIDLFEILGPERYREYFEEKVKKSVRKED